ncbi:MAG TPA: transglutaminase-like domain-containing protein [Micropepsaceae bacterium]|nr:transglutaminase-like domain-containing protein [Micropepsaceae bacterium]
MIGAGLAVQSSDVAPEHYLKRLGESGEGPHDIALAALMLAALDHPHTKLNPYYSHLSEIGEAVRAEVAFVRDGEAAASALGQVLATRYGYDGDRMEYDEPGNADLISVMERRRGLPVALGVLYIHAARAAGLKAWGLFAPGHFLLKVAVKGSEALIDPFNGGAAVDRERFTTPIGAASILEAGASSEPNPHEAVSDTDVLLRLQNNIKTRALQARDTKRAIEVLNRMTLISPKRAPLWLELARLHETLGALSAARRACEKCLATALAGDPFYNEAALALQALKRRLN